jgi:hypothetical protein
MTQAHGRNPTSRDNGQRKQRYPSNSKPHRQGKPFAKTPPARDPTQTASIFKTRSFKLLVDAVGAENIALGLDSNLTRVAELVNGERFTPETAFHIETTLGLPDGFFDQPNPVLTSETIARLKSPLDFIHTNAEPELAYPTTPAPARATHTSQHITSSDRLPKEPEMRKKTGSESPRAVAKGTNQAVVKNTPGTAPKAAPANTKAPLKSSTQQSLPLNDAATVEKIRRANLHVITSRNGSKARLGVLMELSGSNMAHRLHGKKRMDDVEANRFTKRLGLPTGWLDVERSATDIPAAVVKLLTPASRSHASANQDQLPAAATEKNVANKGAIAIAKKSTAGVPPSVVTVDESPSRPARTVGRKPVDVAKQEASLADSSAASVNSAGDIELAASAQPSELPPAAGLDLTFTPPVTSATSLESLQGLSPIAEALLKTLAGKARTGRLDEMKALELLQQAVLL